MTPRMGRRQDHGLDDDGPLGLRGIVALRGNGGARGTPERTADDGALPAADFLANGGTDTAADGTPDRRVDGFVAGKRTGSHQNYGCKQKCAVHVSAPMEDSWSVLPGAGRTVNHVTARNEAGSRPWGPAEPRAAIRTPKSSTS